MVIGKSWVPYGVIMGTMTIPFIGFMISMGFYGFPQKRISEIKLIAIRSQFMVFLL